MGNTHAERDYSNSTYQARSCRRGGIGEEDDDAAGCGFERVGSPKCLNGRYAETVMSSFPVEFILVGWKKILSCIRFVGS